jgi:hypothetical protein
MRGYARRLSAGGIDFFSTTSNSTSRSQKSRIGSCSFSAFQRPHSDVVPRHRNCTVDLILIKRTIDSLYPKRLSTLFHFLAGKLANAADAATDLPFNNRECSNRSIAEAFPCDRSWCHQLGRIVCDQILGAYTSQLV